jgi:hypothetical protein
LAEGVVSEPFLPFGDQGRKVGFAPCAGQFVQNAHCLSLPQMAKNTVAMKLDMSLGTLKNWEFGRTHPNRKS